jgi:hypothetical protein
MRQPKRSPTMTGQQAATSHLAAARERMTTACRSRLCALAGRLRTRRAPLHVVIILLTLTACAFGVLDPFGQDGGHAASYTTRLQDVPTDTQQLQARLRILANWNKVLLARSHLERAVIALDEHHADRARVYIQQAAKTLQTLNPTAVGLDTSQHRMLVKAVAVLDSGGATSPEAQRARVLQVTKQLDGLQQDIRPIDTPEYS